MKMKLVDISEFRESVKTGKQKAKTGVRFVGASQDVVASAESRTVTFVFSDNSVDRYGDTIDARGWVLDNYKSNPIALFGHDSGSVENVIGRAHNVRIEGQRLLGDIEFMEASVNPTAEAVYQMVKGGFLKTVSVGFAPLEWTLTKDKTRPGGVDFKKQELLEISIVPIPANPNALQQAKAAGIDLDRLGLGRVAPSVSKKGLYEVSYLAHLLADLGYLEDIVEWEAEYEGDGSAIPQRITDAMKTLGQILVDMTAEEVAELFDEEDGDSVITDAVVEMEALSPAQKAFIALVKAFRRPATSKHTLTLDIEMTADAKAFLGQIERAGKVLSGANETALRAAVDCMTQAASHVGGVLDNCEPDDEMKAARARRLREAEALRLSIA
jgi:HK97 family phage prohead protease